VCKRLSFVYEANATGGKGGKVATNNRPRAFIICWAEKNMRGWKNGNLKMRKTQLETPRNTIRQHLCFYWTVLGSKSMNG
jgi:hypothetical protein